MTNTNDMDGLDGAKVRALRDTAAKGGDWRTVELCDIVIDGYQMGRDTTVAHATELVAKALGIEAPITTMEHDEYIQVWSMDAASALACFGLSPETHTTVVLRERPMSTREINRYNPAAKLFGLKLKGL